MAESAGTERASLARDAGRAHASGEDTTLGLSVCTKLFEQLALHPGCEAPTTRMSRRPLVTVDHLPSEILCDIFIHLTPAANNWSNLSFWLGVTHVCQHWRAAALDYAPLWSTFREFADPELTKLILARSKNAPLTVEISERRKITPGNTNIIRGILSQTSRLYSVTLEDLFAHTLPLSEVLADATGAAPLLKALTLHNNDVEPQSFPLDFLLGGTPVLERLEISSFDIPWNIIPLPTALTQLRLEEAIVRPLPTEMFESLRGLPALKDLTLHMYLPERGSESSPHLLPALTKLSVMDFWGILSDFMDAIQVPNIQHIDVVLCDFTHHDDMVEACVRKLKSIVSDRLKGLPGLSRLSMSDIEEDPLTALDGPTFNMEWGTADVQAHERNSALQVTLSFTIGSASPQNALDSINTHFDLSTVSELCLDVTGGFHPTIFVDVLAQLPNVEALALMSGSIRPFLELMERDPSLNQQKKRRKGTKRIPPYFPSLVILNFFDINFHEINKDYQVIDLLSTVIKKRPKLHQIESMLISSCRNFSASGCNRLQRALPAVSVEWDKEENWSSDSDGEYSDEYDVDDTFEPLLVL